MSAKGCNSIINGEALEELKKIESGTVDLIVTSPPYNAGKTYEEKLSDSEYFDFINPIVAEFKRILKPDGRFAVNVCFNINRRQEDKTITLYPFLAWIDSIRANKLTIRENIIWDQQNSESDTAWGSWQSASSPYIRHQTENIIIGFNQQWKKINLGVSDIDGRDFTRWTLDKWRFSTERRREHPAPYPEELVERCVKLFSYVGDLVVDPFNGSGTTSAVCKKFNRQYICIDKESAYCRFAVKRVANIPEKLEAFMTSSLHAQEMKK